MRSRSNGLAFRAGPAHMDTNENKRWTDRSTGERVSIAAIDDTSSFPCLNQRGRFMFATALATFATGDPYRGPTIILMLDGLQAVTCRYAADVHDEWHYATEEDFRRMMREIHVRMMRNEISS